MGTDMSLQKTSAYPARPVLVILLVLALAAGAGIFYAARYASPTMVLFVRTMEKGVGRIFVENADKSSIREVRFAMGNDDGGASLYPVELPAMPINRVRIAPLASPGKFAVDRITLQFGKVQYSWDSQGGCSRSSLRDGVLYREACPDAGPSCTQAVDASFVISTIPLAEMERSYSARLAMASLAALLVFCGLFWLVRPLAAVTRQERLWEAGVRLLWLTIVLLCICQFGKVWKYSVDLPYSEEWLYFDPGALPKGLNWNWLSGFYGMHRVVFTKLLAWANLQLFGLNFAWQNLQNYLVYVGVFLALVRLKRLVVGNGTFLLFPAFLVFMFSSKSYENLLWAYQSQIHFVLLFSLLALSHAFPAEQEGQRPYLFILFAVCAMYSFTAGVVAVLTFLGCIALQAIGDCTTDRKVSLRRAAICWLVLGTILAAWLRGYNSAAPLTLPNDAGFWSFYLNLVSLGFGFEYDLPAIGLFCLLLCLLPLGILLLGKETRWQRVTWITVAGSCATLLTLASIAMGRAFSPYMASFSRYAELGFLLIPFTALAWWLALSTKLWRGIVLTLLWGVCFIGFADDWTASPYQDLEQIKQVDLACIEGYIKRESDGDCPGNFPDNPLATATQEIDSAVRLKVNFTRQFRQGN